MDSVKGPSLVTRANPPAPSDAILFRDAVTDMFFAHNAATDAARILCSAYLELVVARLR